MLNPAQLPLRNYKNLIAYQKAKENTLSLFRYYQKQKPSWTERFLVEQLLRAAASIGANIAEGYGRQGKRDYRRFLGIARGSGLETEHWISLLSEIRPQDKRTIENIQSINVEVIKILTVLMKKLNS